MGNKQMTKTKINFQDLKYSFQHKEKYIIINVLDHTEQNCLIKNTLSWENEEKTINELLIQNKLINIIIYGKNCNDEKVITKYNQLIALGFHNVYLYYGGLFEWLLLQDIYGFENFPTIGKCNDILNYQSNPTFNIYRIEN
jgi:hypothetical protein